MNIWFRAFSFAALFTSTLLHAVTTGGVTVGGTRLIYDGNQKEASLSVTNSDSVPCLIQSWVESTVSSAEKAPFIVTPPLFRLDSNQQNVLRIVRTGGSLPGDRESLFWLNIKSIPAGSKPGDASTLQIAVKSRIKLIFRPERLEGVPEDMATKLTWSLAGNRLTVNNPTPFVMNFRQVKVGNSRVNDATYVLPMSSTSFIPPNGAKGSISWQLISDYGGTGAEHSDSH